jgi:hypothetical protein
MDRLFKRGVKGCLAKPAGEIKSRRNLNEYQQDVVVVGQWSLQN